MALSDDRSRAHPSTGAAVARWGGIALATVLLAIGLSAVGLPAAPLFAAMLVGIGWALWGGTWCSHGERVELRLPRAVDRAGQAVLGVLLGTLMSLPTLAGIGAGWLPVSAVVIATLVLSLASGWLLGRVSVLDTVTAVLAMSPTGPAMMPAISRELGADPRFVGVVQYLRLVLILLTVPVVSVTFLGAGLGDDMSTPTTQDVPGLLLGFGYTAVCGFGGVLLARWARVPAGAMLGPLVVSAALTVTGGSMGAVVPFVVEQLAYAIIGLGVGLGFTRSNLRALRQVLPVATGLALIVMVLCAGLGWLLMLTLDIDPLTAYLATTPGGMFVVLATSLSIGIDSTFILAMHVIRMFVMILSAPALVAVLHRERRTRPMR